MPSKIGEIRYLGKVGRCIMCGYLVSLWLRRDHRAFYDKHPGPNAVSGDKLNWCSGSFLECRPDLIRDEPAS